MFALLAPALAGVLGAVLWRALGRSALPGLDARTAPLTVLASGAAALLMIGPMVLFAFAQYVVEIQGLPWEAYRGVRFLLPLVLGILAILVLAIPARREHSSGASLTRRTWTSFLGRSWWATFPIVLGIVLALTVLCGMASERDESGHFTLYSVQLGSGGMMLDFYGWHYSVGPMIAMGVLLAVSIVALAAIARPPHPVDLDGDVGRRRLRSANAARMATGALLLHLGTVLRALQGAAVSTLTVGTESGEQFSTGTSFADLAPALTVAAPLITALGLGLWVFTALSALRPGTVSDQRRASA